MMDEGKGHTLLQHGDMMQFRELVRKMADYQQAFSLMEWDLRTGAPKKGHELRAQAMGTLSAEIFRILTSSQMESYLMEFSDPEQMRRLDPVMQATVRILKKEFDLNQHIPADRYEKYKVLVSHAESAWEDAKTSSDFERLRPYLEQIIAFKLEFIEYWGYGENKYDTLLDQYEPGMTVQILNPIFTALRGETVKLVQAIVEKGQMVDMQPFMQMCDIQKQRQLSRLMLEKIGYDFAAGRLDETLHPFQTTINRFDARVTTRYVANDVLNALFSTLHEGGHALYEQGISTDFVNTPVADGASMGIHESQSRFWENMIGRSRAFWETHYGEFQKIFVGQFDRVSLDDFYHAINRVQPSLIRIEADEVTYNLHVMLRYEIEQGLINETFQVKDLPEVWRTRMQEDFGLIPPDDAQGVLQDVHWSGGDFGYFPTYTLGNIYAAQFRQTMMKELPDFEDLIRTGRLNLLKSWLNEKIHRHGKFFTPAEIVQRVTGEPIDSKYFIAYINEKYTDLYQL